VINVYALLVSIGKEQTAKMVFFFFILYICGFFLFHFFFVFSSLFIIKHQDVDKDVVIFLSYYDYYVFSKVFHWKIDLLNHLLISDHFFLYNLLDHVHLCYQNVHQSNTKKQTNKMNKILKIFTG
jgi:hypothetical protein